MIDKYNITNSNWDQIIEDFDKIYDNKISNLTTDFPNLTKNDLIQIILIWNEIENQDCSYLLNIKANAVYHRRNVIKNRLGLGKDIKIENWIEGYLNS